MIEEQLEKGAENARSGRELAEVLGLNIRAVTEQIERERRAGVPICATQGGKKGYFIAANRRELQRYCNQLHTRAAQLYKTRGALLALLDKLPDVPDTATAPTN